MFQHDVVPLRPRRSHAPATRAALLGAAVLAALAAAAPAQRQFLALGKRNVPQTHGYVAGQMVGDVDGDGDLDVAFATGLFLNDGDANLRPATAGAIPTGNELGFGDFDGDGDLDLVAANSPSLYSTGQNRMYRNDGSGVFTDVTATTMPIDSDTSVCVAVGDVDGDGDVDLLFGYGQPRLYVNDGTGTFTDVTSVSLPVLAPATYHLRLADVDGDGDLDLAMGNFAQDRLLVNDGSGVFTDVTATQLPASTVPTNDLAFADVDGDGDLDLVVARYGFNVPDDLYLNDGSGAFSATAGQLPANGGHTQTLALGDADGDGDVDIFFGTFDYSGNRLLQNDGAGNFSDVPAGNLPGDSDYTHGSVLADLDGDGDLDILFTNGFDPGGSTPTAATRLYLNEGAGAFVDTASQLQVPVDADTTLAVALGDLDGDGDLDVVAGNSGYHPSGGWSGRQNRIYRNEGGARLVDETGPRLPALLDETHAVAIGDVDGDGDLDLIFGNAGDDRLLLNSGGGVFAPARASRLPGNIEVTTGCALVDVDGDGDLDLLTASGRGSWLGGSGQNRLFSNDGTGTFTDVTAAALPVQSDNTSSIACGDVDGDGDIDVVFGNALSSGFGGPSPQNLLYRNNGNGTFTDATLGNLPALPDETRGVALGDVDGDGDLDLFVADAAAWNGTSGQDRLYENDGSGLFTDVTAASLPPDTADTNSATFVDFDEDGDLDLVLSRNSGITLLQNDGTGTFLDVSARLPDDVGGVSTTALGDLDLDGDIDVFAGVGGQNRLLVNLRRQLVSPFLLRTGRDYTLEAYARFGPPSLFDVALPYLSTAAASIALPPLGRLGIDPGQMIALGTVLIPQPAGVASIAVPVPNVPALAGIPVYGQALMVPWPYGPSLSNTTVDVLLR